MLRRLNEATHAQTTNLPGWGLHPLKGRDLKGHFSVSVSGNWRLTFSFDVTLPLESVPHSRVTN